MIGINITFWHLKFIQNGKKIYRPAAGKIKERKLLNEKKHAYNSARRTRPIKMSTNFNVPQSSVGGPFGSTGSTFPPDWSSFFFVVAVLSGELNSWENVYFPKKNCGKKFFMNKMVVLNGSFHKLLKMHK